MRDMQIKPSEFKTRATRAARAAREKDRRRIDATVDEYATALAGRVLAEQALRDARHAAMTCRAQAVRLGVGKEQLRTVEQSVDRTMRELAVRRDDHPDPADTPDDAPGDKGQSEEQGDAR